MTHLDFIGGGVFLDLEDFVVVERLWRWIGVVLACPPSGFLCAHSGR